MLLTYGAPPTAGKVNGLLADCLSEYEVECTQLSSEMKNTMESVKSIIIIIHFQSPTPTVS